MQDGQRRVSALLSCLGILLAASKCSTPPIKTCVFMDDYQKMECFDESTGEGSIEPIDDRFFNWGCISDEDAERLRNYYKLRCMKAPIE